MSGHVTLCADDFAGLNTITERIGDPQMGPAGQ